MTTECDTANKYFSAIEEEMQMEGDYLNELLMKDEIIAEKNKIIEEDKKALTEKDKIIAELERRLIGQGK